jgi:hypothetical protein
VERIVSKRNVATGNFFLCLYLLDDCQGKKEEEKRICGRAFAYVEGVVSTGVTCNDEYPTRIEAPQKAQSRGHGF